MSSLWDKCCGLPCLRRDIAPASILASPGELHRWGEPGEGSEPPPLPPRRAAAAAAAPPPLPGLVFWFFFFPSPLALSSSSSSSLFCAFFYAVFCFVCKKRTREGKRKTSRSKIGERQKKKKICSCLPRTGWFLQKYILFKEKKIAYTSSNCLASWTCKCLLELKPDFAPAPDTFFQGLVGGKRTSTRRGKRKKKKNANK